MIVRRPCNHLSGQASLTALSKPVSAQLSWSLGASMFRTKTKLCPGEYEQPPDFKINTHHWHFLQECNLTHLLCSGVTDVGTGLQAVAAAITDPDTISAFQSEDRNGSMSRRTFYGGMHELSGGLDDAASGIHELAKVLHLHLLPTVPLVSASHVAWWQR